MTFGLRNPGRSLVTPPALAGLGTQLAGTETSLAATRSRAVPRHLGLDLVRAIAIILVVISHARTCFPAIWPLSLGVTDYLGTVGVELFFSLSGFLIGGLLLDIDTGRAAWLGRFWARRWLRTLPAYFFYLAIVAWFAGYLDWPSVFFVQRFFAGSQDFYGVSWSLAMEEWFYLLFPLLLLPVARLLRMPATAARVVCGTALLVIVVCVSARAGFLHYQVMSPWLGELSFSTHPIVRLDCCAYGMLLAGLVRLDAARVKAWLVPWSAPVTIGLCLVPIAIIGTIFCLLVLFDPEIERRIRFLYWGNYFNIFEYAVLDCATAGVVAGFYFGQPRLPPPARRLVTAISRTSYSLYLLHPLVNGYVIRIGVPQMNVALGLAIYLAILIIGSALSYRLIERPFLKFRDARIPAA
jgi:peptidoglycan/LPS O-acetylase OafA/YrhL